MNEDGTQLFPFGMVATMFHGGDSMGVVFRNGTESRKPRRLTVSAVALLLGGIAAPAFAQEEPAMDQQEAVSLVCEDGTQLQALFDETSVEVTLADGQKVQLPQQETDKGFLYTNGKFQLSGDEESARWTVGKKKPVPCQFQDQQEPSHFDEPLTVDTAPLPKDKANPEAQPQVNCYRFAAFMVKEVDLGEKGAEKLAITPADAACERAEGKDEKPVKDELAGYFMGAKGGVVFFQAADGWNGGLPFVAYDAKTMTRLFDDSFEGNDFDSLDISGTNVTITYRRVYSSDCSLYLDGTACAQSIKKATGLGEIAPLPDCGAAYDAEKKRTPDYAKEIEQLPSVISYDAELKYDGKSVSIRPLKGETSCNVPS
jgi:hypothetical protein